MAKKIEIIEEENIAFLDLSLDGILVRIDNELMNNKNIDIGHCISLVATTFQALRKSDIGFGSEPLLEYYEPETRMKYYLRNTQDIERYVERWAKVYGARDLLVTLKGKLYYLRGNTGSFALHKRKRNMFNLKNK